MESLVEKGKVFQIGRKGRLSLEDANQLVSIISRFTREYGEKVNRLVAKVEGYSRSGDRTQMAALEKQIDQIVDTWNAKVRKLGCTPKGLWIVDLDAGDGYYCWKFPETEIKYWHEYHAGYGNRKLIESEPS